MTPYELNLHAEIYQEKQTYEHDDKLTLVWMGAYLQRVEAEKFPSLKEFLEPKQETNEKPMTADEMYLQVLQLNSALDGTVKKAGE